MRVSKEKAAQNRHDIVTAAARLFCEQGVSATGVDAITNDASLTHGAVYSQFGSKEVIAAEAIRLALQGSGHLWQQLLEIRGHPLEGSCHPLEGPCQYVVALRDHFFHVLYNFPHALR